MPGHRIPDLGRGLRRLVAALGIAVVAAVLVTEVWSQPATSSRVTSACHVSPIVADVDKSARFYHDLLGLDLVPSPPPGPLPVDTRPEHLDLHGIPQAKLRFIGARMPSVFCGVELVEFSGIDRHHVERRIQDPGAAMLILLVRDLDTLFARLKAAGTPVVTTSGMPMTVGVSKTRAVVVKDPDGHPVELAQLEMAPQTAAPASSNVVGIRLRVTVDDTDKAIQYYRSVLGIDAKAGAFTRNEGVVAMMGLPSTGEYRLSTAQLPASALVLEFIEFRGLGESKRTESRVQDPGSYRLQLNVSDIDATLAALKGAGSRVVSTGGVPVSMTFGTSRWRLAVAPDFNSLFLIVQQRLGP
jgi:catechol 2,3-dioxygenase-like lactoylglutathione lyase family enzyme